MFSRYVVTQVKHNSFFLVGLVLGLLVALVAVPFEDDVSACVDVPASVGAADEFEPHREEKPLGSAGQTAGRSVQRPRYYSTELGMKGSLLAGVLSSEAALGSRVAALNRTAARLQPALRFFITASTLQAAPGLPNVVGFTDTREMLKPFHALKYLADNYLEEYDFFFLVSDASFVNARRLTELVSKLSVSQDIYMGTIAEDDSNYCSLEGGILLSNSVLRSVHAELDWCVRNSYSPRHHENIGRCVLHAAHKNCVAALQGESYESMRLSEDGAGGGGLTPALADAVTAHPVTDPDHLYRLHAYTARVFLERAKEAEWRLRAEIWRRSGRLPRHYRNATWPGGLRADLGMADPAPPTRFDHQRWTSFNGTHSFLGDDFSTAAPLAGDWLRAAQLAVRAAAAHVGAGPAPEGGQRGGGDEAGPPALVEGAWRWDPARGLRWRVLLRARGRLRRLELLRPLGAARLARVPYVTESARVALLLPVTAAAISDAHTFLARYAAVCLARDDNTALLVVYVSEEGEPETRAEENAASLRAELAAMSARQPAAALELATARAAGPAGPAEPPGSPGPPGRDAERAARAATAALAAAGPRLPRRALLLLAAPHMDFNEDFLNRVRMNTIAGVQWYAPVPFSRHAQLRHPRFLDEHGARPQRDTGRFNVHHALAAPVLSVYHDDPARYVRPQRDTGRFNVHHALAAPVLSVYHDDYQHAAALHAASHAGWEPPARMLAAAALRCVRAPEPALLMSPRPAPCPARAAPAPAPPAACLRALRGSADGLRSLNLGAPHALARLLLELQAEAAA
ncbi:LOW QUALITY PROTEIN: chondroitin sulfate synthase 2 [Achroia grisella]|uniref:LOW QUALITY PROTEIN: chondroitin sulfate synthase 2 n=1 Tax=Achroia grisella TaxID=688607 RepID=UPI0027D2AB53|nr:LOW QUALITY PROTEIN: chondroitin sulfate synthase 2 [Achroia grisella]